MKRRRARSPRASCTSPAAPAPRAARSGRRGEGQQTTASTADGAQAVASATYTWKIDGSAVQSTSSNTYTPTEAVEGHTLTLDVSFNDPGNNAIAETETGIAVGSLDTVAESPTENATISIVGLTASTTAVGGT